MNSEFVQPDLNRYKRFYTNLCLDDDMLKHESNPQRFVILVSFKVVSELVFQIHCLMAYIGSDQTFEIAKNHVFHPDLRKLVREIVASYPKMFIIKS